MQTKTVAKKTNAKAPKAPATKATKKNATVAKPTAKDSKPASKKLSQIEAAIEALACWLDLDHNKWNAKAAAQLDSCAIRE